MALVRFFTEDTKFKLPHPVKTSRWIKNTILKEKKKPGNLNFIFCSDDYLREINIQYLNHKTYTDIVTFDSSEEKNLIEGDIFISIDRVKENSEKFSRPFDEEIHRVIIHGVLHLIGYTDKTAQKKTVMRRKEDSYLSLR
ncbi:MAG TPA: rRNA maturation RNase YbeY [Ohtaekwangia sp.]|uniref:rRNA maturation RNase YbeY n=1 Tax=Ohtaekwangia sp. TaxID=2066019 RepID=UPI002F94E7B6